MTFRLLAIAFALSASNAGFAQTDLDATPKTMLGFLQPGMRLGVSSVAGTTSVVLRTYTENNFTLAQDLARQLGRSLMSATFVAKTNPTVSKELEEYATRLTLTPEAKDRLMLAPPVRTSFGTVTAVGDDFVLLDLDDEQKGKRVIPKASIGTIYLDANPVRFIHHPARSRTPNDG